MADRVANFYKFVELDALTELRAAWRTEATARRLKGTVLLAQEGVNAGLSGAEEDLTAFLSWVREDLRFADVTPKIGSPLAPGKRPYSRLLVKVKPWIIRFAEAADPSVAAIHAAERMAPTALQAILADTQSDVVVVDTRNDYEMDHGAFRGAVRLPIKYFTDFPEAFLQRFGNAKDRRYVFYCTGGIRCEKVVPWAQAQGFNQVTQLDGGILEYFRECGDDGFDGRCFVFDHRWIVDGTLAEAAEGPPVGATEHLQPKPPPRTAPLSGRSAE